ncbi:MAG: arginine repressor [Tetrasphaera sp.]
MTVASSRGARQQRIVDLLGEHAVRSQIQLLELLAAEGIEVTQATLSRDLVELSAERVRVGKSLIYAVPGEGGDRTVRPAPEAREVSRRLAARCQELLVSAATSANLVVLRTPPGAASFLASAIDHGQVDGVLGSIAGDDTIMLITEGPTASETVAATLLSLSGKDPA